MCDRDMLARELYEAFAERMADPWYFLAESIKDRWRRVAERAEELVEPPADETEHAMCVAYDNGYNDGKQAAKHEEETKGTLDVSELAAKELVRPTRAKRARRAKKDQGV